VQLHLSWSHLFSCCAVGTIIWRVATFVNAFFVDNDTFLVYTLPHKGVLLLTIGDRIKAVRDSLGITQAAFADKIGSARNTIANYEIGRREPMESTIKSICREFNVNYDWIKTGKGEMFEDIPNGIIEELANDYDLDELDKQVITEYLKLTPEERTIFKKYLLGLSGNKKESFPPRPV